MRRSPADRAEDGSTALQTATVVGVGVGAATCAVFSRLLTGPVTYLQYDDEKNYVDVRQLYELTAENFEWILWDGVVLGVYEPVALSLIHI